MSPRARDKNAMSRLHLVIDQYQKIKISIMLQLKGLSLIVCAKKYVIFPNLFHHYIYCIGKWPYILYVRSNVQPSNGNREGTNS